MKPYQMIALDIDGTLLNSEKKVPPECACAIRQAAAAGKTVVFCTSRAVSELEEFFDLLPEIRYAVFASGGGIYDIAERRAFALRGIPRSQADAVMDAVKTKDLMPQIVLADRDVIQASQMAALERYHMGVYRPLYEKAMTLVEDIFAFYHACQDEILKINLYHADPAERIRTREQLSSLPIEKVYSEESSLECSALGINKGTGLKRLCDELGILPEHCIAVGDAENDIPMIRAAGLGVAMGNAPPHVRREADRVVGDLDHGGCAEAVRLAL